MRIAISILAGRVSPVFDTAKQLLLADVESGRELQRMEHGIDSLDPLERSRKVVALGIELLICGAISWPLEMALASAKVQVICHVCGDVEEVLGAFLGGALTEDAFLMPGSCGSRRRRRGVRGRE